MPPSITRFPHCADCLYTKDEVLKAERYILKMLGWNLSYPTPSIFCQGSVKLINLMLRLGPFLSIYSKFCAWSGDFFLHLLLSWQLLPSGSCTLFLVMRPGYIFSLVFQVLITQLIIQQMPNLAHYSSYAESHLVPTANTMLNYLCPQTYQAQIISWKICQQEILTGLPTPPALFTTHDPVQSSVQVHKWALDQWNKGTKVTLTEELPTLKALIRAVRAA